MHSWASWYVLILGLLSILGNASLSATKNGVGWGLVTGVIHALLAAFFWFVVLPAGGFVW